MSRPWLLALAAYLVAVNLTAFAAFGLDKRFARRHSWRIPERFLLLLSALGGGFGAVCGMCIFHHKTQHPRFRYGVPALFLLQLSALYFLRV